MKDSYTNSEIVPPIYVVDGNQDDDEQITLAEVTERGVELGRFAWCTSAWMRISAQPYASPEKLRAMLDAAAPVSASDGPCAACGHARAFHGIGTGDGVPFGTHYCDDRHGPRCSCRGFVEVSCAPGLATELARARVALAEANARHKQCQAERDAAVAALRGLVRRVERDGGHSTPEEQHAYWEARELVGKGWRAV